MPRFLIFILPLLWSFVWLSPASAQYVLALKNGRQIIVQSYREEGGMVKFSGLGGEIAISKDQVQSIRRTGDNDPGSATTFSLSQDQVPVAVRPSAGEAAPITKETKVEPAPEAAKSPAELRALEEKAYQQKIKELTGELQKLRDQYGVRTRGNTGPEPQFFTSEEAFAGHQADLLSRLRDAQFRAQGLPSGSESQSPPFSLDAPPAYTERQKELSDLRSRIRQVESDRQKLIDEMKAKDFDTGGLFLD